MPTYNIHWVPDNTSEFEVFGGNSKTRTWRNFVSSLTVNSVPVPIGVPGLPIGFHTLTGIVSINLTPIFRNGFNPPYGTQSSIASGVLTYNSPFNLDAFTFLSGAPFPIQYNPNPLLISVFYEVFTLVGLINNSTNSASSSLVWSGMSIDTNGTYDIISSVWVINNLTHPNNSKLFSPGDTVQITTNPPPPPNTYDFTQVTQIRLNGDTMIITLQTQDEIQFIIPPDKDDPNPPITLLNPASFSGEALVGFISIVRGAASGIYTITPGKTNDTLYIGSQSGNQTTDNKIPDPFAKTGFIGG